MKMRVYFFLFRQLPISRCRMKDEVYTHGSTILCSQLFFSPQQVQLIQLPHYLSMQLFNSES